MLSKPPSSTRMDSRVSSRNPLAQTLKWFMSYEKTSHLDAYRRAGLTVDDIDVFETHDCFSCSEYAAISSFGITELGKESEAIENGVIAFDGAKPINPSGGLIASRFEKILVQDCQIEFYKEI